MRPLPSLKGWMQRKSRMKIGISSSGSNSVSCMAVRKASQSAVIAPGVSHAETGSNRTIFRPSGSSSAITLSEFLKLPPMDLPLNLYRSRCNCKMTVGFGGI